MKKKNKLIRWLRTKRLTKQNLMVYKPCMYYVHRRANIRIEKNLNFNIQWDQERILRNKLVGSLYVADGAALNANAFTVYAGSRITINKGATLTLGSGYMNYGCVVECFHSITIGHNVAISEHVVIRDSDNHKVIKLSDKDEKIIESEVTSPIVIEDHVWIGMGATILKGVTIGNGSIVAAGSLVNKNVPPHSLVAGIPAKVVKTNVTWDN